MQARPEDGPLAALARMLAGRVGGAEVAIYAAAPRRMRLAAVTPDFAPPRIPPDAAAWPGLLPALARNAAVRIDPAAIGLGGRFCALQPLVGPGGAPVGLIVLWDGRPRRLGSGIAAALADAAEVAAPLLAAAGRGGARAGRAAGAGRLALSRAAARRMIDAERRHAEAGWSLLLVDLDRFHAVNAALGDAAGDALLALIAARFEACMGPGDRLARLDGDRFVATTARAGATALAARLLVAAREPATLAGRGVVAQASIGVVAAPSSDTTTRTVLAQADAALRRAKAEGGNRLALHEAAQAAATQESSRLELDLAEAQARGQLRLVYQGYIDLADGRLSGAEALMRWRHPRRGELQPAAFIPIAEASGLILPLGSWALRAALAAAARWPGPLALSVNVSALQFHQPGFVAEVDAALRDSGVPPGRLELEITETVLMRDNPETRAQLDALMARGVRIALDDFGTGYSALAYLARLPHNRIKLDGAFVRDLGNPATRELVRAILALAQRSDVAVTAEGVESADQLRLVRELGFTHAQGFLTGAPVDDPRELMAPQPA